MPLIFAALIGGLVSAAATFAGRILIALGIGLVVFSGVSALVTEAKVRAFGYLDQASAVGQIGQFMGILQIGTCLNILFSAYMIRLVLHGLTGDSIKRWVTK